MTAIEPTSNPGTAETFVSRTPGLYKPHISHDYDTTKPKTFIKSPKMVCEHRVVVVSSVSRYRARRDKLLVQCRSRIDESEIWHNDTVDTGQRKHRAICIILAKHKDVER